MPWGDTMMPSWEEETLPIWIMLDKHDGAWEMCEGEDVFGQLHVLVSGVDGAGDAT